jgi:hypothetical protein
MQLRFGLALAVGAMLALSVTACGSDDENSGGSSGQTVKVGATFVDYVQNTPIEGIQVCTLIPTGRDPGCADSIATGQIVADGFPINSEVLFKLTKDDYLTTLIPAVTGDQDDTGATLYPVKVTDADLLLSPASLSFETGKGAISFIADQSKPGDTKEAEGQPDVGVTISPAGGTMAYLDGALLDKAATATFASGLGIIVNLDPGEYTLTFTSAEHTCTTRLGWSTDEPNVSKVPVQADTITYVLHQCGE